jgi:uncharacterized protein YceH (UPF0502 family)
VASVWVNPERLKELANRANAVADTANSEQVARKVETSCDGLPGSSLQWAARQIGQQLERQVTSFSESARSTADRVSGAAKDYRMTDEDAAAALAKSWPAQ